MPLLFGGGPIGIRWFSQRWFPTSPWIQLGEVVPVYTWWRAFCESFHLNPETWFFKLDCGMKMFKEYVSTRKLPDLKWNMCFWTRSGLFLLILTMLLLMVHIDRSNMIFAAIIPHMCWTMLWLSSTMQSTCTWAHPCMKHQQNISWLCDEDRRLQNGNRCAKVHLCIAVQLVAPLQSFLSWSGHPESRINWNMS